jgi:amino acid transporter
MAIESFGYKQELKRSLTFLDLVMYGVVFMLPVAPFVTYGYVSDASSGMVAMAYIVGMIAMLFTALSYKALSEDFPLSGSVYAYARRGIGEGVGFIAGWMLILDYLLLPAFVYVVCAVALYDLVPAVPRWIWVVAFLFFGTLTNYFGVQTTAALNKLTIAVQLIVLTAFILIGLYALYHGRGAGKLTLGPLYQPGAFKIDLVFSAVSICAISFLGFDAISTMAEEVKGDNKRTLGNATMTSLILVGVLFVVQTWIAADLANGMKFQSLDTAFYEISALAGGKPLTLLVTLTASVTAIPASIVAQAAISRLLFAMARDRKLPNIMASVHPRFKTPHISLLFVAAISLVIALGFLDHLDTLSRFVNFGAVTGFLILHVTVVIHFVVKKRSRAWGKHLVSPVLGFVILTYVLYSMGSMTWKLGLSWLAAGIVYFLVLTRLMRRNSRLNL